ncbi:MAG TPA: CAP domain-containing protein [Candidatus Dormibacteraeota bacterium]|nr:CAP domain-containing protein [Candidatus Dormibacteraeota bacterium]
MRSLLSRGALVWLILLAVVAIGYAAPSPYSAPTQHALLVQSAAATTIRQIFDPASELLPREVARRTPTPSAQPRVVAARVPQRTAKPKPVPASAAPSQAVVGSGQWRMINQDRQAAGLAPLQWSPCLANVATGQAARMAAQGYISHANGRSLDLACHLGSRASESIGFQGGGINDAAMNAWFMGDPIHRANIMGPYRYVGVAWVIAPNGTAYLAIEFG